MTEYTWDKKTGKVKAKGTGKKPIELFPITKKIKNKAPKQRNLYCNGGASIFYKS